MTDHMNLSRTHPRIFAGLWFGCAGSIAIILIPVTMVSISGSNFGAFDPGGIALAALIGFAVACPPGLLLGAPILTNPPSLRQAIIRGMGVALCADLLFAVGLAISSADGKWDFFLLGLPTSLRFFLFLALPVAIIGGVAGWLLHTLFRKPGNRTESGGSE